MKKLSGKLGLILLLLAGVFACSKKDSTEKNNGSTTDREAVILNLTDEIIIPSYANFKIKLDAMLSKTDVFTNTPTLSALQDLRTAWVEAYTEWQKVEQFDFGPAELYALRGYFNIYPANVNNINANISAGSANLDLPANYSSQGFPAYDYLLNGLAATDAEILAYYTTAADASKRRTYLKNVAAKMNEIFSIVHSQWNGSYRDAFIGKTGVNASSAMSILVNGYIHNYERSVRSGKFGIPSGAMLNGTVDHRYVEAFYKKDISLTLAKTAHQAAIDFFAGKSVKSGKEGPSLKSYLSSLAASGTLATDILSQFNNTTSVLNAIPTNNLSSVVQNNNQLMINVYTEMQKSVRLLKVDMTSAMSITITYTDNDGD